MKFTARNTLILAVTIIAAPAVLLAQPSDEASCEVTSPMIEKADRLPLPIPARAFIAERLADLRDRYSPALPRHKLAALLASRETAIGIRPDQQEAWRAYSNAVLALVPTRENVVRLIGDDTEDVGGPQPFGRIESLADVMIDRHAKATALKKAIVDLRAKLSPEQLEAARVPRLLARH